MSAHRKRQRIMQDALAYGTCTCPGKNTYTSKARAKFAARTSNFRKLHKLRPYKCGCGFFHLTTNGVS